MRKTLIGIVLTTAVLLLSGSLIAQAVVPPPPCNESEPACVVLPKETPIKLLLKEPLRSDNTHPGDSVAFEVAKNVDIDGITVIPKGALAYGIIKEGTEWARRLGRGAWIFLELRNVTDVTGREIPVFEPREGMGSNRPDQAHNARYMQARGRGTEIVLGMPNPYWLLMPGKHTYFPEDQIFVVVTREKWPVDLTKFKENCGLTGCNGKPIPTKAGYLTPSTPEYQKATANARAAEYQKAVSAAQAAASAANRQVVSRRPSVYTLTGGGALIASR